MPCLIFVCVYNACRSQISQAICRKSAPDGWVIQSAGVSPSSQVDQKAVEILKRNGLVMDPPKPKGFADLTARQWDHAVAIGCGDIRSRVSAKNYIDWDIADPQDGHMELYEDLYNELKRRISGLIKEIKDSNS
ncbi:MAG: low molecular weight phosphatase family protein [Elusimicrobia bacterium]|nr:low molecular weight phosphatase family protein [Elusimicrobiota bacterium]